LVIAKEEESRRPTPLSDAAGFFGWKIRNSDWGYGTFDLALTFPETVTNAWDAELLRALEGTLLKMQ
jgi:hypothetical protein